MTKKPAGHQDDIKVERQLLAALCAAGLDHQKRAEIFERLGAHTFVHPDHEVIFRALAKMPHASTSHLRETLSARLTRLGFPDIEVELIFGLEPPSSKDIQTLLRELGC